MRTVRFDDEPDNFGHLQQPTVGKTRSVCSEARSLNTTRKVETLPRASLIDYAAAWQRNNA
jgi:hypothetical protein